MSNGKVYKEKNQIEDTDLWKNDILSCQEKFDEYFSKFVMMPHSKYLLLWQIFIAIVYIVSIGLDSLIIAFRLTILLENPVNNFQMIFSAIMIVDIILQFFVAYRANQTEIVAEDDAADELIIKLSAKVGIEKDNLKTSQEVGLSRQER